MSGAPPFAFADGFQLAHDHVYTVGGPGVLANDWDPNGDAITAVLYSNPAHGTINLQANGGFSFTPTAGYVGADSFLYRAFDGTGYSNPTTVSLQIVNQAPTPQANSYSLVHDQSFSVSAPGLLANDTDPNQDALTVSGHTNPTHGTLTINADGSFTYTPATHYVGSDSFTYTVTDGIASATANVSLTITNQAPTAQNDAYTLIHDQVLDTVAANLQGLLANDSDPDSIQLSAVLVIGPTHGTLNLQANGSFIYTPAAFYVGQDSFTYKAFDEVAYSNPATVTIQVTNLEPQAAGEVYFVSHDEVLKVPASVGLLANDYDPNFDELTGTLVVGTAHGTVQLTADGSFSYTPTAGFQGQDWFTYRLFDGIVFSAVVTAQINVLNDAPQGREDRYLVNATEPTTVIKENGLLVNDPDPDNQTLTAQLVSGPTYGTLVLNADGSFTYTPGGNFTGQDTFLYRASDGVSLSAPVTVHLGISPVARDDYYWILHDQVLTAGAKGSGVLWNDDGRAGEVATVLLVAGPTHGTLTFSDDGTFTYQPSAGFVGVDSFTYQIQNGPYVSNVATVYLKAFNDPPVAPSRTYDATQDTTLTVDAGGGVLARGFDPNGDPMTAQLTIAPQHGALTLNADGGFVFVPQAGFFGPDVFGIRPFDGLNLGAEVLINLIVGQAVPPPAPVTFLLTGTIQYDPLNQFPVRGAVVELWAFTPGGFFQFRRIATTFTDELGKYKFVVPLGFAPNSLRIRVLAATPAPFAGLGGIKRAVQVDMVSPLDGAGTGGIPYSILRPIVGPNNADFAENILIDDTTFTGMAFYTFDAAFTAARLQASLPASPPGVIHLYYSSAQEFAILGQALGVGLLGFNFGQAPTTSFTISSTPLILTTDFDSWDTIIHEYGHAVAQEMDFFPFDLQQYVSGYEFFRAPAVHSPGFNLRTDYPGTARRGVDSLAFSEGWANFYSMVAQDADATAPVVVSKDPAGGTSKDGKMWAFDVQIGVPQGGAGNSAGEDEELTVMRILWDLFDPITADDTNVDLGKDRVGLGFQTVFNVVANIAPVSSLYTKVFTLSDLWKNLEYRCTKPPFALNYQGLVDFGAIFELNNVSPKFDRMELAGVSVNTIAQADPGIPVFIFNIPQGTAPVGDLLNEFKFKIFDANYTTIIFSSFNLNASNLTLLPGNQASWTPTAVEWGMINAVKETKHLVVMGSDTITQTYLWREYFYWTGYYWSDAFDFTVT